MNGGSQELLPLHRHILPDPEHVRGEGETKGILSAISKRARRLRGVVLSEEKTNPYLHRWMPPYRRHAIEPENSAQS